MKVDYFGRSDIGNLRQTNQDGYAVWSNHINGTELLMAVVCDGMGGTDNGALAVEHTLYELDRWFETVIAQMNFDAQYLKNDLELTIKKINHQICQQIEVKQVSTGTTLSLVLLVNQVVIIKQVGDSRVYTIQDQQLMQITKDQATIKQNPKTGKARRYLTNCIGYSKYDGTSTINAIVTDLTYFIITTDGLHEFIRHDELENILQNLEQQTAEKVAEQVINEVKAGVAADNITLVIIKIEVDGDESEQTKVL